MKILNDYIQNMITSKNISARYVFKINGTNYSSYLTSRKISYSKDFGASQATFVLNNDNGIFGGNGAYKIDVGDRVQYSCYYGTDSTEFKRFYGTVRQRSIPESASDRSITLTCMDELAVLQDMDIDLTVEAEKFEVTEEILTPNYLESPNDSLAQVFDFANDSIADNPLPVLSIINKNTDADDPLYQGMTILYDNGQVKLGLPLNALDNYDLVAHSYFHYPIGVTAEDVLEAILTQPDGYGGYLFGETSAQDVIDNHLTENFSNVKGTVIDTMYPNYSSTEITLYAQLTEDVEAGATELYVDDASGFPDSGEASINGDVFTWTSRSQVSGGWMLSGISQSGDNAIKAHATGNYVEYANSYSAGTLWYLSFSNVITDLTASDFSLESGQFKYFDKKYGRIILEEAISTSSSVTCSNDYYFKTLQSSGIYLNKITFRSKDIENRFEAVNKVRDYLAPNYIIRTIGDEKIWATYLSQKTTADYTLQLASSLQWLEDEDLYTRVLVWGKNKNPTNFLLGGDATFTGTGESYKAIATASELAITDIDEDAEYYIYKSPISDVGKIILGTIIPQVYINDVAIDNKSHLVSGQQVTIEKTEETTTTTSSK